tara:strand:- start:2974 stop:3978 length:1005 start_codon:yes stop_codon:yes gene_type:complete
MAFLDNSGDIILDAVLTELGRKRMADGNFRISKFAVGDDEINYTLYDKNHASGSAYYDLEIMQTPIFQPLTTTAASINYGLLSFSNNEILYMPSGVVNELVDQSLNATGSVFYIAVNAATKSKLEEDFGGTTAGAPYVIQAGSNNSRNILFELGLDTTDISATANNRLTYLTNLNLVDDNIVVSADNKFINGVMQITRNSVFKNDSSNTLTANISVTSVAASTAAKNLDGYNEYTCRTIPNLIYLPDTNTATTISAISGPRAVIGALNVSVAAELATESGGTRSSLYTDYGRLNQTVAAGSSYTYDLIDTMVYIAGTTTGTSLQIPIRIARLSN